MMTLGEAKQQSLWKWEAILSACPDIKLSEGGQPGDVYGSCGFCEYFGPNCQVCPLYPHICSNYRDLAMASESLYWRICIKLEKADKRGLKQMIQQMIREIGKVNTRR